MDLVGDALGGAKLRGILEVQNRLNPAIVADGLMLECVGNLVLEDVDLGEHGRCCGLCVWALRAIDVEGTRVRTPPSMERHTATQVVLSLPIEVIDVPSAVCPKFHSMLQSVLSSKPLLDLSSMAVARP
jgi:hypothetical protein